MYSIRRYRPEDRADVEKICIETANGIFRTRLMRRTLLETFLRYYTDSGNCFVACDEDRAVGYILFAKNYDSWKDSFLNGNVKRIGNPVGRLIAADTVKTPGKFSSDYPAHLHINILPEYQRQGLGMKLLDKLKDELRSSGVKGVMLCAGKGNEKGINFYRKSGFDEIGTDASCIAFGMKL